MKNVALSKKISKNLRKYCKGMTYAQLAYESGLAPITIQSIIDMLWMPRVSTLLKICNVLDIEVQDLLR